jgi:hypothetical protein
VSVRRALPLVSIAFALGVASSAGATAPGPNGRVAFSSSASGNSELYSVNADGSALRQLTWTPQTEQAPAWSPDGARIAYESDLGGRWRIWVMNADGSAQTQLSPAVSNIADDMDPAWSPDGAQIAFASTRAGNWNLWTMNADGSGLRQVSSVLADDPAWSPNGQQLAYVGTDGIGVMGVDGSDPHVVSAPGAAASGPSWSPDGRRIVFSRNNAQGYPGELYVANADGSGERQLTSDGFENARPSWSPDGTQIVFQRTSSAPFGWTLWSIGADGSGLRQLASNGNDLGPDWGSSQVVPDPSPPGAPQIVIYSPTDGGVYVPGMQVPAVYTCSSATSYVVSCQGDVSLGGQVDLTSAGVHSFTVRAVDLEGRTATATVTYQVLDLVPPQIDLRTPPDGASYDLGAQVTVDYSCADPNGTGVAYCAGDRPSGAPLATGQAGTQTFTVTAVDNSGNVSRKTATYTVVDRRPPSIQIAAPADGAVYTLGSTVQAAYWCQSPSGAHIVSCDGTVPSGSPLDVGAVGAKSFTVVAFDENGRTATLTHAYSVVYAFNGFDSPVSATGSIDDAKAGEATPLKFSLAGYQGLGVVARVTWQPSSCADWSPVGASAAADQKLSYSASTDRYLDLVATDPAWKGSCRTLDLQLADGTHRRVHVSFTH